MAARPHCVASPWQLVDGANGGGRVGGGSCFCQRQQPKRDKEEGEFFLTKKEWKREREREGLELAACSHWPTLWGLCAVGRSAAKKRVPSKRSGPEKAAAAKRKLAPGSVGTCTHTQRLTRGRGRMRENPDKNWEEATQHLKIAFTVEK